MKKGTKVVCKNCGTEYVWGKKRKLSGGQNIAFYLCYFFMILLAMLLVPWILFSLENLKLGSFIIALCLYVCFVWPCAVVVDNKRGFSCPECRTKKCIPANSPVAKRLIGNK